MMPNFLSKPAAASTSGVLASMAALVLEYKSLMGLDFVLLKGIYVKYIEGRFKELKVYSRNFEFSDVERKRYADLVIQFESVSIVVGDRLVGDSDMNQTLLGENA